jgi:hypothetical protein
MKKLTLRRESIRTLTSTETRQAAAGDIITVTTCYCTATGSSHSDLCGVV